MKKNPTAASPRCRRALPTTADHEGGFTLLEALVAIALLAIVLMHFLGTRTEALIDAANARNWRIAREIAEHRLSILEAGAHELPPENRTMVELGDDYPNFRYQILIGEAAISDAEAQLAEDAAGGDQEMSERLEWQRERETLRRAGSAGVSYYDYEQQQREEELEERPPSEDEFEEVAVLVYFPDLRAKDDGPEDATFMLRAKVSTMAIAGLTPEESEARAEREGLGSGGDTGGVAGIPGGN